MTSQLQELLALMERLRAPDGCPWDREQTFASIAPHTVEEAYEVADAIERGDLAHLKDELGDLLFQVVFHAQMAREQGAFDFDAVAAAICDKLRRRHPHVFGACGTLTAAEQSVLWEDIKAEERRRAAAQALANMPAAGAAAGSTPAADAAAGEGAAPSALSGVPRALPALMRAFKLSKRAARVGFDFEHSSQSADKVAEELAEVREAAAAAEAEAAARAGVAERARGAGAAGANPTGPSPQIVEEVGDLLFAAANLARKLEVDAEAALRAANAKFERRFRAMEALATARGERFAQLRLEAQEQLWLEVKRAE